MSVNKQRSFGIQSRLIMLAILPVTIIALGLGYYLTSSRLSELELSLEQRGQAIAKGLAPAVEFGLFAGNLTVLRTLADNALLEPDIVAVDILSENGEVVWQSYDTNLPDQNRLDESLFMKLSVPVERSSVEVSDFKLGESDQRNSTVVGWVNITLSKHAMHARRQEMILTSLLWMLGGLLFSLAVAIRMGRKVAAPILDLTQMVERLGRGHMSERVREDGGAELTTLQRGVNQMADALHEAHCSLHQQIEKATHELQETVAELERKNRELELARKQALQASQAKTDFLAKMSHEIRTPVNAIIGFSRLLQKSVVDQEQIEHTRTINQAASQLLCIINDILNFSKLELGTVKLEKIPFDIRDCLEDVITMFRPAVHEKGLELVLLIHSDVPVNLIGDPTRISQILSNLVNNAIKFTAKGGVTVQVLFEREQDDAVVLRIEVTDTGIGMSETDQQGLFRAFSQADSSINRRFGGTGLGLSIAKRLAELMKGDIGVRSETDVGSCFWITIHCQKQNATIKPSRENMLSGLKTLIYDVHPLSRRALRNMLLNWQMGVFNCGDMNRLTQLLREANAAEDPFALLVLGLSLDEMQPGLILTQVGLIRQHYVGPLLLLIGAEHFELPGPLQDDSMIDCIAKPARRDSLHRHMMSLLLKEQIPGQVMTVERPLYTANTLADVSILLADDNEFNLMLVTTLLRQNGAKVMEAINGEQAIDKFSQGHFDLVLMDIHMPVVDGIEATRRIRQLESGKQVPIIALTADVFADHGQQLLHAGLDDCLFKPITEESLWGIIQKWVGDGEYSFETPNPERRRGDKSPVIELAGSIPRQLIPKLYAELPAHIDNLNQALAVFDLESLLDHAHKLHGVAGYFGIDEIQNEAKKLEQAIARGENAEIELLIQKLSHQVEQMISSADTQ